jgi:succinate-semialdehyde dehydrogenase / glutarate-semialdehyde dehydrogenase
MKCSMELGGNAPFIVFDDADLDAAVQGAIMSKYRNNGQTCVCANRIYVQAGVYDAFAEKLAAAVAKMKVGDGLDDGRRPGPLINAAAVDKVEEHIADALAKGGKVLTGGERACAGRHLLPAHDHHRRHAGHGGGAGGNLRPARAALQVRDRGRGDRHANDTIFGLAAYFYARDIGRITRVQEALEYGIVGVNTGIISTEVAPFGGVKQSGLGREGSRHGIEDYLEMKYVCLSV